VPLARLLDNAKGGAKKGITGFSIGRLTECIRSWPVTLCTTHEPCVVLNKMQRKEAREMRSIRLAKLLLVGMAVLLTLMNVGAVWAVPPDQELLNYHSDEYLLDCPDFEVWADESVKLRIQDFYDRDGTWTRTQVHLSFEGIWYNHDNGFGLEEKPLHYMFTFDEEGETMVGMVQQINLPGAGPIIFGAGRVVLEGGEVTFWAGPNDWIAGDFDALCSALSGP
jgi:hypothetical protein